MFKIVRAVWQLIVYFVLGLLPFIIINVAFRFIIGKSKADIATFALDVIICVIAHGEFRTISGMTGDKSEKGNRYHYQEKVIDFLMKRIDGINHCENTHEWEVHIAYDYYNWFKGKL
jgi:hypothetical protein